MLPGAGVLGEGPFALWERSERSRHDSSLKLKLLIPPDENFSGLLQAGRSECPQAVLVEPIHTPSEEKEAALLGGHKDGA
jgi:hypothetical protein